MIKYCKGAISSHFCTFVISLEHEEQNIFGGCWRNCCSGHGHCLKKKRSRTIFRSLVDCCMLALQVPSGSGFQLSAGLDLLRASAQRSGLGLSIARGKTLSR